MKQIYIIQDWTGTTKFNNKTFNSPMEASDFLAEQFPVIYNNDGTQNDREDDLGEFFVAPLNK